MLYIGLITVVIYSAFSNWYYDDPFITYRYAQNLTHGNGFVYNPGERVLSTTTPLFTLLLAILSLLWSDIPSIGLIIGSFSLAMGAIFLWELSRSWGTPIVGWVSLILYPTFPLLLSTLGSETPLYLAFCLGAFTFYARKRFGFAAVFSALATLTRPDGALIPVLLGFDYLLRQRRPIPWRAIIIFAILTLPWFVFAWAYFGSPIPATLTAKQHQGGMVISQRFAPGLLTIASPYFKQWYYFLETTLAILGIWFTIKFARSWLIFFLWIVLYTFAYSILGVSRYFWYYAPLVPGFVALVGLGIEMVLHSFSSILSNYKCQFIQNKKTALSLTSILIIILAIAHGNNLWNLRGTSDARYSIYHAIGDWLKANSPEDATIGALEVGIIGYYAQRPMVDFAGLIQPAVSDQLSTNSTYTDAAAWAIENYQPEYLVLHSGLLPQLEDELSNHLCRIMQSFQSETYDYPQSINIYMCHPDDSYTDPILGAEAIVLQDGKTDIEILKATNQAFPPCENPGWFPTEFGLKDHTVFRYEDYYYLISIYVPPDERDPLKQDRFAYARSKDLCEWEELPPILSERALGSWDETAVWAPYVYQEDETYYLYYTGVTKNATQSILLATSNNPSNPDSWQPKEIVFQPNHPGMIWENGQWADCRDPTVVKIEGKYYLYYSGRDDTGGIIGIATAPSLLGPWNDQGKIVQSSNNMLESPTLINFNGNYYLFYNHSKAGEFFRIGSNPAGPWQEAIAFPPGWANEIWRIPSGEWFTSYLTDYTVSIAPILWDDSNHPPQPIIGESSNN